MSDILELQPVKPRQIHVVGGGTIEPVREHLALAARAYGSTARFIADRVTEYWKGEDAEVNLHLTRMADPTSNLETSGDLLQLAEDICEDKSSEVVFWSPTVADFHGQIGDVISGPHAERLDSSKRHTMELRASQKIIKLFRGGSIYGPFGPERKDLFVVGFKTTTGVTPEEQYSRGLALLKGAHVRLVLANDTVTRNNMIIVPEEAVYDETTERQVALENLVEMAHDRSKMHFVRTEVLPGELVDWNSEEVPDSLHQVVDYCIEQGAYKEFRGVTTGHFSYRIGEGAIVSSRRHTNFNNIDNVGMVRVFYKDNKLQAVGAKPSAGARAQIAVYERFPEYDCIVHTHCPLKPESDINTVAQRPFECGSLECGENTANGLVELAPGVAAVMLDKHGTNFAFNKNVDPQTVINLMKKHVVLGDKTGGYIPVG